MTLKSLAIFSTFLAARLMAAQAQCTLMGNVTLFWGTTAESTTTATPLGWSTSATAPTDATGNGLLAVRSTISPTLWGAFVCTKSAPAAAVSRRANGGTTSGPPGGSGTGGGGNGGGTGTGGAGTGGNGGGTTPTTAQVNMLGAIADSNTNLCLTASAVLFSNITVSRQPCINSLSITPAQSQAWQWTVTEVNGTVVTSSLVSLAFMGTESASALPVTAETDYPPALAGSGVGAYVTFSEVARGLNPEFASTVPGLVINFADLA
ncbi:hypothetical protein MSAN_00130800 [Mycena sanguinolenta]|uniref:Uncharacterized protein n=1 Tax=Mycena sanguinolenta TaxID=230812 RepID=A0A8H6ZDN1_9AGAR|nr:hypothetical protein MSAN_00130800 [Mycena sanguinolenta]